MSPFRKATVLATLTDPAEMLSMVTCTGLPDTLSMLFVSVVMNCGRPSTQSRAADCTCIDVDSFIVRHDGTPLWGKEERRKMRITGKNDPEMKDTKHQGAGL